MGLFIVLPLDDESVLKIRGTLKELQEEASLEGYTFNRDDPKLMRKYSFVLYDGTPDELSGFIQERLGNQVSHLVIDMSSENTGGLGPSGFVQWVNRNG